MTTISVAIGALIGVYLFWNLATETMGFFMPLIYQTVGKVSAQNANLLQAGLFACTAIGTYFVFMRLGDKISRRGIFALSSIMAIGGIAFDPNTSGKTLDEIEKERYGNEDLDEKIIN